MAYVGPLCILQNFKAQKSKSDLDLSLIQMDLLKATRESSEVTNYFANEKSTLNAQRTKAAADGKDTDQIEYEIDALNDEMESELANIAYEEEKVQTELAQEQTKNAMLQTQIENYNNMVQSNIEGSHSYGYQ